MEFEDNLPILSSYFLSFILKFSSIITKWYVILVIVISLILLLKKITTLPSPKCGFVSICPSIMITLGSGGHTWEIFKILSLLKHNCNYLPNYIVANGDILSENSVKIFERKYSRRYFINKVVRPRNGAKEGLFSFKCISNSVICFIQSIKVILSHKPDIIIANGPSTSVPIMLAAWLLNLLGVTKITLIYVESMARIKTLSISAKILRPFVNNMFSWWREMCETFKLTPLANISINHFANSPVRICEDKINKTAFVTVGTTEFDDLISHVFGHEFQSILINMGFSKVIVQVGSRSQHERNTNFKIFPGLNFKIVSIVNEETFLMILRKSDLIISHGGSGTLFQALELQKSIIAIVNPKTVGNHQGELINYLKENSYIHSCDVAGLNHSLKNEYDNRPLNNKIKINNLSDEFVSKLGQNSIDIFSAGVKETKEKFSVVIPSTIKNESQLKTLFFSLREFLDVESVDEMYIIVPKHEVVRFSMLVTSLAWKNVQISVISETDLIPEDVLLLCDNHLKSRSGWFKQQIVKLKAADIVQTDYYLILDSDCILRCPLNYSTLIRTNEMGHKRSYLQTEEIFKHPRWYKGSSKLLGITEPFMKSLKGFGIGVTPQVLSIHIVKQLMKFLQEAHQVPWPILLANNRFQGIPPAIWTEYTLYYLFAERTGLLDKYHVLGRNNIANYYQSVWTDDQVDDWNPLVKSNLSVAPFVIFQSNLGLGGKIPYEFLENIIKSNSHITSKNRRKKIYFICSELEFYPVVGGINTFIRVIISSFQESIAYQNQNVELIFCGIKCGQEAFKDCPFIPGISFKFFSTSGSRQVTDLSSYFKSFLKFSNLISDLQEFGQKCTNWILSDCEAGDVCVSTIVYELNIEMIKNLLKGGLKMVHTVHSLVARKAISTFRVAPFEKFNLLDKIRVTVMGYVFRNEKLLMNVCKIKCLSWTIPKILTENVTTEKFLMENSRAIFVPSRYLTETTVSLYTQAKDRINYVPWGLPIGRVLGEYFETKNLPRKPPINEIHCLALCKLIPQKGIDLLIDSLKKIEQIDTSLSQKIKLKICGDMSYMNVSAYFLNLKSKCDSLKMIEVEFTGWLEGQAKWDVMNQSDLLLVSSLTEPFGFSVIEAMKVGMGIISFETEGPLDIVNSTFGRLVPLNVDNEVMSTDFALAIIDICYSNDASQGFQQIKQAARRAAQEWNMQTFFETLFSLV